MNLIIFVLSKFRTKLLAAKHLIISERTKFDKICNRSMLSERLRHNDLCDDPLCQNFNVLLLHAEQTFRTALRLSQPAISIETTA